MKSQTNFTCDPKKLFQTNRKQVISRLDEFISGGEGPKVLWSEFDDEKINGAFIAENNTILINKEIKDNIK